MRKLIHRRCLCHELVAAFLEDPSPNKVNLAQGAYRTEEGQPLLLDAVRKAEERVVARGGSKEYLGAQYNPANQ